MKSFLIILLVLMLASMTFMGFVALALPEFLKSIDALEAWLEARRLKRKQREES